MKVTGNIIGCVRNTEPYLALLEYLATTETNQNYIHEEIQATSCLGNACCPSVYMYLSSRPLYENIKLHNYNCTCCFVWYMIPFSVQAGHSVE
jgi:hypothetical protein